MGDKITKSPSIRFAGFTDALEQRKFNEVFIYLKNNSLSRSELNYEQGTIKNIHYGDVLIRFGEVLDTENDEIPYISNKDFKIENTSVLQNGDIVIADAAEDETVGKCTEIKGMEEIDIVSGLHTIPCRPTVKFGGGYLGYYINSNAYHDQLLKLIQGTKVSSISKSALKNTNIIYPYIEEQKYIGNFFINLDNIITLHKRKLELLKDTEKAMIQKVFPKYGEDVPEFRFTGFTDAWEKRKFSELYQKINEKNDLSFGPEKIISVANMYYKKELNTNSTEEYMKTYNIFRIGDIAFEGNKSKKYSYGRFVENDIGDGIVSHVFDVFRPIVRYDLWFWKYLINNEAVMAHVLRRVTTKATMMTNLVANDFLKATILVPSIEEQERIGEYFKQLDNLITLHQRELDLLKDLKKSMLQQMFI